MRIDGLAFQTDGPSLLTVAVNKKHNALGCLSQRGKLLWPDGAAVGAKDVANANVLPKTKSGEHY